MCWSWGWEVLVSTHGWVIGTSFRGEKVILLVTSCYMKTGISPGRVDPFAPVQTLAFFFPGNIYAHPYSNYLLQAWPKANNPFPLMYSVWVIFSYCLRSNYLQISYISLTRYIENKFDCQYIWLEKNYTIQEGRWLWKGQWLNPTMPVVVREGERRQRNLFRVREREDL